MKQGERTSRALHTLAEGLTGGLTGFIWAEVFLQFCRAMLPRLLNLRGAVVATPPCATPDCDFSVFWPVGVIARQGNFHGVYDPSLFVGLRAQVLGSAFQRLDWFYPPPSLLPVMAASYLPFNVAFFAWIGVFLLGAIVVLLWAGVSWPAIALGLLSPAGLWSMEMGQFEMFSNALLVAGLLSVTRAPGWAGGLLGLLVIKPQTGILAPFGLLAKGQWKALLSGAIVVGVLLLLSWAVLGSEAWKAYVQDGLAASRLTLTSRTVGFERGVSVFWMARSFGAGLEVCYAIQGLATLGALGAAVIAWRDSKMSALRRMALMVFLTLLTSPFGYVDDMVAWSLALAALSEARGWRLTALDGLCYLWPALCPIVVGATGLLLTPLVVMTAVVRTWRHA
jgi:hypothetical protein